jgi:hypothetical protein
MHDFWVALLGERGEAREVGEEGGDLAAFALAWNCSIFSARCLGV